ncbi:MAG: 23S rRNA (guanosine(2251)-2'-O)-methyltransferase RlmB [Chlorobium sp.]|jgi:23S rRNA (guanosine2251-2'-O)-methyltransferase|uniref:23S rRNA (guanosine(2251)-2'-O)-methyltransferase RlmB n=1 Tax=Chlorobium sp. TaxID=1095 RepID=UPI001D601CA7|nr:23S rRNA (guanosine(2251)-2'-O)-methyltransferase RlmB [Chlorobium sp.]MBN1278475.1 23S rRNA (guanosine(2251)-2'-O)-methyltransferase RlmB [Chlorobiaceae bacterium]MCF8215900.1 23S rRNA (guanosine(2251)-2'-O)-methyltransferase RlmB [Chlorobium sp.]MCF8270798.1 23S rRNA (guanosine(2251)-2'-O)-methyltransferase RlmB [Chlorobium sp.]MCF8287110.1 23S rRNA (guanosine(2251)-2'-O)-methyltransferase RlmB [Chlorobium sp.]MCF8290767.1 23S rRNA (guanosine(2251)-2'-O)-methyltransferase RlmB [Chlorobium
MQTEQSENVVYGRNAVLELLQKKPESIEKLYFQFNTAHPKLKEIVITARRLKLVTGKARLDKLNQIAGTTKHQGVCALISTISFYTLDDILAAPRNTSPLLVVLQGLEDPHNIGAIIRTAEAAAADAVVLIEGRGAPVNAAVHKASAGALSHIRLCKVKSLVRSLEYLRERGFRIYATDMEAELNYTDAELKGPAVLVLGAEGSGLSPEAMKHCDSAVRIPIAGCVESLNVSVTAGILLYEAMRQRLS